MQISQPTQHLPPPRAPSPDFSVDPGRQFGPICGAISSACAGATISVLASACALLGGKILQAAGNNSFNPPPFVDLVVPMMVGATVLFGAMGFVGGLCNSDRQTM